MDKSKLIEAMRESYIKGCMAQYGTAFDSESLEDILDTLVKAIGIQFIMTMEKEVEKILEKHLH